MARKINQKDLAKFLNTVDSRGRNSPYADKYPLWFNGETWLLEIGKDFRSDNPYNFAQTIRAAASKRNYKCHIFQHPQGILIIPHGKLPS